MDESQYQSVVGIVTEAHYYEDMKAIRFVLCLDNGKLVKMEWPITMFKFAPGMDRDKEMRKTASLMPGKKIKVVSTAEPQDDREYGIGDRF